MYLYLKFCNLKHLQNHVIWSLLTSKMPGMLRSKSCKEFPEVSDWSEENLHEKWALKAWSMQIFHMAQDKHFFSVNLTTHIEKKLH